MHIDAHQHFWQYNSQTYSWITEEMAVLQRDYLPPDLGILLSANGFAGSVAVQALQTEAETAFLLKLASENEFIKGVVGWVDLRAANCAERLSFYARHPKFKGVRHVVQDEPDEAFLLKPLFLRGIGLLNKFNLTYDILIYPNQLPVAAQFVKHFPEQPFVLDHLAKPFIKKGQIQPWAQDIKALATSENVYCKLSGLVTEADWHHWKPTDFIPYLDTVLEAFGSNRLMIGSDWPVCNLVGNYTDVMHMVKEYLSKLTFTEQENILGHNASRFYNLNS